ncbi:ABC transporter substrate-binding protein [Rhodoligotrophos defluvii]|uniref:ABC transporter substrate-binding protein n=1 Tax=Rhodoligotrophos defluvii TaxID=2561934 RepID=UPI0010C9699C|nr:ABC transporter substrate-binding protein [Rhodoligotrophos defluvii]
MKHSMRMTVAGAIAAAGILASVWSAQAQTTYNVAGMADFTGPYADIMKDWTETRHATVRWWNEEVGKGLGVQVNLKDYDNRYDVAQVASLWPGIKAEINPVVVLGVGGPDVAALQNRLPSDKVPMVMATASYGYVWKPDPWVFNPRPTYSHESAAFCNWLREKRGGEGPLKVGIISSEASPAYVDIHNGLVKYAKDNPDKVEVVEVVFTEVQPTDLTTQVNRLLRNGVEAIVIQTNTAAVVATKRALQTLGKDVPIMMSSHNGILTSARAAGDMSQLNGDYEVYGMAVPTDAETEPHKFFNMLSEKYGLKANWNVPSVMGLAQMLVALRSIEAAAKKVGPDKVTGEAVREAILSTPIPSSETFGVLPDLKFTNEAPFPPSGLTATIATVEDGKYVIAAENVPVPDLNKW